MKTLVGWVVGLWLVGCGGSVGGAPSGEPGPGSGSPGSPGGAAGDFGSAPGAQPGSPTPAPASAIADGTCVSLAQYADGKARIATIALDTGTVTDGAEITLARSALDGVAALGRRGEELYVCVTDEVDGHSGVVQTIALTTGVATKTTIPCSTVTTDPSGLWLMTSADPAASGRVTRFADLAGAQAKQPTASFTLPAVENLGPGKDTLYGAWHSSTKVLRIDRSSGASAEVTLEGFGDGWIYGVSSASGGRLVVSSPADLGGDGALLVYEGATGKRIGRVGAAAAGTTFHGVACGDGGEVAPPTKIPSEPH